MDKTDKPLPKQPLSFPTSSLSSQDHPAKRNEENDTDALFAGLFEENIQDIRKTPQELQPSQTEHTIETEQATVPTLPPYSLSETWWEMSSSTQAHSAQEQEHPTPSNAPSTLVNAHQAAPNALDRSENSLQDLIAVLEQDISRLRKERVAHSSTPSVEESSSPSTSLTHTKEAPPKTGRLLSLLDESPVSAPSSLSVSASATLSSTNSAPAYPTTLPSTKSTSAHPATLSSTATSPKERSAKSGGLYQQAEEIEAILSQNNHALDAYWKEHQGLQRFLEKKGYPAHAIPTSRYLFAWPTWSWLFVMGWFALSFPVFGIWAQAGASLALMVWLLEQGLGWSISAMLLPTRARAIIHLGPPHAQDNGSVAENIPKGQETSSDASMLLSRSEESSEIILAVPYRGGDIEPGLPRVWLDKLPTSWRFLVYLNSPRLWGVMGGLLWLMLLGTPWNHRAVGIVTWLLALLFVALMGVMAWSFYRNRPAPSPAWSLALSLHLYEQAMKQASAPRLHLVWFDARDGLCAGERLAQEEIVPNGGRDQLWLGISPFSPADKELVLVESETYLQSIGLHPQIAQILTEENTKQLKRRRLKTRYWTWPFRLQKRPILLLGSSEALGMLEVQAPKAAPDDALASASSKEQPVFRINGSQEQRIHQDHTKAEEGSPSMVESTRSPSSDPVTSEISLELQSFLWSFLKEWQAHRARSPWLWIVAFLLGAGLSATPCAASTRCAAVYQSQTARCEADYSRRLGGCRVGNETKNNCVRQEKQGTLRCKAVFDRVKGECGLRPLPQDQHEACRQKAETIRQGCQTPEHLKETCTQALRSCKAACSKEDFACEERCQAQQITCLRDAEDRWIRCQREARSNEEKCKRSAQDQEVQRVYQCLQESAKARLKCQRSKRDERLLCEDNLEDQSRKCRRSRWDERKNCYEAALQKRLRCRE